MWAQIMKGWARKNRCAMMLRFPYSNGWLHAYGPATPQQHHKGYAAMAMSAVMGGTQSLHTNGYDEALSLPTEEAAVLPCDPITIIAL
jgi:methylmalonyl-CoA mutase N-terminal domain/subunit